MAASSVFLFNWTSSIYCRRYFGLFINIHQRHARNMISILPHEAMCSPKFISLQGLSYQTYPVTMSVDKNSRSEPHLSLVQALAPSLIFFLNISFFIPNKTSDKQKGCLNQKLEIPYMRKSLIFLGLTSPAELSRKQAMMKLPFCLAVSPIFKHFC